MTTNSKRRGGPAPAYEDITETTGIPVSDEGADMLTSRYEYAASLASGRRVLEVGCAAGQGLGLLAAAARSVVGGDYSMPLLASAKAHYGARIPFTRLSVEALPFPAASFDLVLFFEASYYVPDMEAGFDEIARVLTPGGIVVFVNANPERPDFIRSPHSHHYHTGDEFRTALVNRGFDVRVEAAFPVIEQSPSLRRRVLGRAVPVARRALESLHLVPRTLRGRARIKRLVMGKLRVVPAELPRGFGRVVDRDPVSQAPVPTHKVLYVTGVKRQ